MVNKGRYHPNGWFYILLNDPLLFLRSEQIELLILGDYPFFRRFFQLGLYKNKSQKHDQ